jgi:hypothetical protein
MYSLRFPFELPPGRFLTEPHLRTVVGDLDFGLDQTDGFYVITVKGFASEDTAAGFMPRIWAGLAWALINRHLPAKANMELQKVPSCADKAINGERVAVEQRSGVAVEQERIIKAGRPAILLSDAEYRTVTASQVEVSVGTRASDVLPFLIEGAGFPNAPVVLGVEKIRVALDLYRESITEESANARFLTLVMTLEALAERKARPTSIVQLLGEFGEKLDILEKNLSSKPEELAALESLKRELIFRKEDSIRSTIRSLVLNTLSASGATDTEVVAEEAVEAYDKRSTLLHKGSMPHGEVQRTIGSLQHIVERVIREKFLEAVADHDDP